MDSPGGQLLRRALEMESALDLGLQLRFDEIPADEFQAILAIRQERNRWEEEKTKEQ